MNQSIKTDNYFAIKLKAEIIIITILVLFSIISTVLIIKHNSDIKQLKIEIENLDSRIDDLKQENSILSDEISDLKNNVSDLESKISDLENRIDDLESDRYYNYRY